MTEKITEILPVKNYWAIVRTKSNKFSIEENEDGSIDCLTDSKIFLVEFDTAIELDDFNTNASVSAGESMGEEEYSMIKLCMSWQQLAYEVAEEKGEHEEYHGYCKNCYGEEY